jgi:proteasome assembly chaperone (PAC2) family protein
VGLTGMDHLTVLDTPPGKLEYLLVGFGGWPDAAEGATTALKYLSRRLGAKKLAEIDPEEFYDFTRERPRSSRTRDGRRRVHWPANEFSYWVAPGQERGPGRGLMFFVGVEPHLKWRTFARIIADLAAQHGVRTVVHVGALLDAVPHTRPVRLTGSSTLPDLQRVLDSASVTTSNYQGPTGIGSAVMEACAAQGMGYASLWGHTAHYLQAAPNYRVSHTLAQHLVRLLDLPLDLAELQAAAETFDQEVAKAIAKDEQLPAYVQKLEQRQDAAVETSEMPDPAEVVRELEEFLRSEQRRGPNPSAEGPG